MGDGSDKKNYFVHLHSLILKKLTKILCKIMASSSVYEIYSSSTLMILISWGVLQFKCIHSGTAKQ